MKFRTNGYLLIALISALAVLSVACGNSDEPAAETTPPPATPPTTTPSTSEIVTNDTPVPGSTDGAFEVSEGSEATFTVNEKLSRLPLPNDAVMRTGDITGDIDLSAETAELVINLHALESDDTRRDRYIRDRLFPTQSTATISVADFPDIPEIFASGEAFTSTVIGKVNVNGTDADVEFTIESRLDPDRLLVLVKGDFTWDDFDMTAPTSNFFVVKDEVHVEVLISAIPK